MHVLQSRLLNRGLRTRVSERKSEEALHVFSALAGWKISISIRFNLRAVWKHVIFLPYTLCYDLLQPYVDSDTHYLIHLNVCESETERE